MAAVTTAGRRSRRKSRRIASACAFLSSISLDGNIAEDVLIASKTERNPKKITEAESSDLHSERRTLLHLISEPSTSKDIVEADIIPKNVNVKVLHRQRSATEIASERKLQERSVVVRRSVSLCESNDSSSLSDSIRRSKSRISCLTGNSFHHKRRATDKRIVLCYGHRAPFVTYSVLKYHKENQEAGQEGMRKTPTVAPHQFVGIEGVELGSAEKTVSYRTFLTSTYPFGWKEAGPLSRGIGNPLTIPVDSGGTSQDSPDAGFPSFSGYDPHLLDDPELTSGRHRKVLNLASYLVSMVAYAKPSELKKDLNEQFREKFPNLSITLTKLRSLKKDIMKIASTQECQLDPATVAYAFVYFEKLILKEKINKANRKLLAGSCLLLAAKFNDDMRREKVKELIEAIEDKLRVSVKELLKFEFQAVVALQFDLHVPQWEVLPHVKRLETE
ncbi:CDK5 and ABL1 enzyme substrate 1-like isoform X3 [Montipora foliosa]|uniref:CDK5 and ABL1 enzyme substrate 1-like isoform X3 n=1 Tax=Montipora foliosa TaxID=591990 RepID=UPI0035F1D034